MDTFKRNESIVVKALEQDGLAFRFAHETMREKDSVLNVALRDPRGLVGVTVRLLSGRCFRSVYFQSRDLSNCGNGDLGGGPHTSQLKVRRICGGSVGAGGGGPVPFAGWGTGRCVPRPRDLLRHGELHCHERCC